MPKRGVIKIVNRRTYIKLPHGQADMQREKCLNIVEHTLGPNRKHKSSEIYNNGTRWNTNMTDKIGFLLSESKEKSEPNEMQYKQNINDLIKVNQLNTRYLQNFNMQAVENYYKKNIDIEHLQNFDMHAAENYYMKQIDIEPIVSAENKTTSSKNFILSKYDMPDVFEGSLKTTQPDLPFIVERKKNLDKPDYTTAEIEQKSDIDK